MTDADDEAISIWGHEHQAVVVTHDRAMIRLREKNTFGVHVWLDCADTDAVDIMTKQLSEIVNMVTGRDSIVLEVTRTRVTFRAGQWH